MPCRRVSKPLAEAVMQRLERLEQLQWMLVARVEQLQWQHIGTFCGPEVSCVDPNVIAESLPQDFGCLTPDLRHEGADGHAHQTRDAMQPDESVGVVEATCGDAGRNIIFQQLEVEELEDFVAPCLLHAQRLLKTVRDEVKAWPPVLGKDEEEGSDVLRTMVCSQTLEFAHEVLSSSDLGLSDLQTEGLKKQIEKTIDKDREMMKLVLASVSINENYTVMFNKMSHTTMKTFQSRAAQEDIVRQLFQGSDISASPLPRPSFITRIEEGQLGSFPLTELDNAPIANIDSGLVKEIDAETLKMKEGRLLAEKRALIKQQAALEKLKNDAKAEAAFIAFRAIPRESVTDADVKQFVKQVGTRFGLPLRGCKQITNDAVFEFIRCENTSFMARADWTKVDLHDCRRVTDEAIVEIARNCPALEDADLYYTDIKDIGVTQLSRHCRKLSTLDLTGTKVTDVAIKALVPRYKFMGLEHLDKELVRGSPNLRTIYLEKTKVTNAIIDVLAKSFEGRINILSSSGRPVQELDPSGALRMAE